MDLTSRITMDPLVMRGKPTIRKMRFTVVQLLELLAGGMTTEEILEDYPYLEQEDIVACLQYAVKATNTRQVMSFA
ncbi:MAG: DUF433 domain-containing protein [Bacteroidota bacterium]